MRKTPDLTLILFISAFCAPLFASTKEFMISLLMAWAVTLTWCLLRKRKWGK